MRFKTLTLEVTDGIVIECTDLKVDESSLTGESVPVSKNSEDKIFMLSGCAVVEGVARYLVIAVGKNSEWGKIMSELDTERPDTPLQVRRIPRLTSQLSTQRRSDLKLIADKAGQSCRDCWEIRSCYICGLLRCANNHLDG